MEFYQCFGFLTILKESVKLLSQNIKLMASVTILTLLLSSIFFLIFRFSSFSLMRDMLAKESLFPITSSSSAELASYLTSIRENFPRLLAVDATFILAYFLITSFSTAAIIIVASTSYNRKTLSIKELSLRFVRSWTRPLITGFYTTILVIGYVFLVIALATPLLITSKLSVLGTAVLFGVVAYIFYLYISAVWILALVVSLLEEERCSGIEALGKSAEILKGRQIYGFALNVLFSLLSWAIYEGSKTIKGGKWLSEETSSGLFLVNCSSLVKIFTFMAYSVLYLQCKEKHREVELQGSIEYQRLSNTRIANGTP